VPSRDHVAKGAGDGLPRPVGSCESPAASPDVTAHGLTAHEGQSRDCVPESQGIGSRARYADGLRGMHSRDIPMTSGAETR
jgi:hypothetical protein